VTVNITLFVVTQLAIVLFASVLRASLHRAARAEAALQAKVAELEAVMDLAPVGIWFAAGPEVREVTRNRYAVEMLRTPAESTAARGASVKGPAVLAHMELRRGGRALPPSQLPLQRALRGEESRNEEYEAVFGDGSSIALLSNARPIRDAMGRITGAVSASLDVTALKRTEAALRDAIAQRELLQREADHRIKNSLQLVASVLRLQRGRVKDEAAAALLDEAVARVSAVAEAHAALHRSPDLLAADAGAMVEELCHAVGRLNPAVTITCWREGEAKLEVERAIPLGLIVSELLTNAVRHAFPEGAQGKVEVRVAARPSDGMKVEVSDDGTGMPLEEARDGSLGRELVRTFAAKIGAQVETRSARGEGTTVTVRLHGAAPDAQAAEAPATTRQPA
jgi:two-component sensor histidine kinase